MHDKIKHPKHYTQGIECWDYITSHKMGYLEGNIVKYVTRYKDKDGLDDLFKAKAYLQRLIEEQFGPPIVEQPLCNCEDSLSTEDRSPEHYPCQDHVWGVSPLAEALEDVRKLKTLCKLDGRNCPPECSCGHPERGDWPSEKECAAPLDIVGNAWTPEIQAEIERENLAAHDDHVSAIEVLVGEYSGPTGACPPTVPARSGGREDNTLGDYRRGGPATSSWMQRPCRYDPHE